MERYAWRTARRSFARPPDEQDIAGNPCDEAPDEVVPPRAIPSDPAQAPRRERQKTQSRDEQQEPSYGSRPVELHWRTHVCHPTSLLGAASVAFHPSPAHEKQSAQALP